MGYHVSILRTGGTNKEISEEEIVSVVQGKFGFILERDKTGSIKQAFREIAGEEIVLYYDQIELWAKDPSDTALKIMIDLAGALGNGARVRGDEGETYKSLTSTYYHEDDACLREQKLDWRNLLSLVFPLSAALLLLYAVGKILLQRFWGH